MNKSEELRPIYKNINEFIEFYDGLSLTVMNFIPIGTRTLYHFDAYIYEAMKGTLESISVLIQNERINDAYALLRKFFDISLINVYVNLYLKREYSIDNLVVDKIQNWLSGKEKIPEYKEIRQYIATSELQHIQVLLAQFPYGDIRERCKDHMHYNFFNNLMMNTKVFDQDKNNKLDLFLEDMRYVILLNLSYIFYLNPHYMTSSDVFDYLDCSLEIPVDMQYHVAPYIKNIFENLIDKEAKEIGRMIRENTDMQID